MTGALQNVWAESDQNTVARNNMIETEKKNAETVIINSYFDNGFVPIYLSFKYLQKMSNTIHSDVQK